MLFYIYSRRNVLFPMTSGIAFKNLRKIYLAKKCFNTLPTRAISDKNYEHILKVRKATEMNNIKDFNDLCLKVNGLLLLCV